MTRISGSSIRHWFVCASMPPLSVGITLPTRQINPSSLVNKAFAPWQHLLLRCLAATSLAPPSLSLSVSLPPPLRLPPSPSPSPSLPLSVSLSPSLSTCRLPPFRTAQPRLLASFASFACSPPPARTTSPTTLQPPPPHLAAAPAPMSAAGKRTGRPRRRLPHPPCAAAPVLALAPSPTAVPWARRLCIGHASR